MLSPARRAFSRDFCAQNRARETALTSGSTTNTNCTFSPLTASTANPKALGTALRNMIWVLGDKALAMALGLLIFGLIGRKLGPVGSGHFAFAAALLQIGLGLSLVVSGSALLPRFCRMHGALPGAIANVFVVRLAASLVVLAGMLAYCLVAIGDPQRRAVSMVVLLAMPLIEPFYVVSTYWLSRNHNRPNVVSRSSALIARTVVIVVGLHYGVPIEVLAGAWVMEGLVSAAMQVAQLRSAMPGKPMGRFVRASRASSYLRFGLRFVPALWLQALFLRIDRLILGERMDASSFGLYATAMQLTEVWTQVAYLVGVSLATAYLYQRIRQGRFGLAFLRLFMGMAAIGAAGLAGAWWSGEWLLRAIFGPPFVEAYPLLLAGMGFAVLLFANQIVQLTLTTLNRPRMLLAMWAVASMVAVGVIHFGYHRLGAYAGPVGLAAGTLTGWIAVLPWRPWVPPGERGRGRQDAPGLVGATSSFRLWRALWVPFAYFFMTRVPSARQRGGWCLSYLLPVLGLAVAAHGDGAWGLLPGMLMLVAVYSAYEFGYLVNDTVVVEREADPTLRVDAAARAWFRSRLWLAFVARAVVGFSCLGALAALGAPRVEALVAAWIGLWVVFALYNHRRGRETIALYLVLTGLRFVLPVLAAAQPGVAAPHWALLLLLYPMPNAYEAAWKPRYRLERLRAIVGHEHRFRTLWHALVFVAFLAWATWAPSRESGVLLGAAAYYLALRSVAWWMSARTRASDEP